MLGQKRMPNETGMQYLARMVMENNNRCKLKASRGEKGEASFNGKTSEKRKIEGSTPSPRNPENLTKAEELYVKDSLKDLKAGRFEVSDSKESSEELLQKLKKEPESLSFPISDWKGRKARVSFEKKKVRA